MNAAEIAARASELVGGDRAKTHGDKSENFNRIAAIWNGTLRAAGISTSRPLDGHDVCNLMETMKVARRYTGSFNVDDYVDGAGYAACAGEVLAQQVAVDQSWVNAAIEGCPAGIAPRYLTNTPHAGETEEQTAARMAPRSV